MQTETPLRSLATERYFPALTGLRAVAAYLVFLHHYNPVPANMFAHRLFVQGYIGVSIFFVLSGFLIYYRYADVYFSGQSWFWRSYLVNRFARVFPLYLLLWLLTVGVGVVRGQRLNWPEQILNITLLKGFFADYQFSGLAQSWSLTVELCFYALAPLLFVGMRRWGAWPLTAGLTAVGLLLWKTVGYLNLHGLFGDLSFVLFYTFFGRSFEFMAGMWLADNVRKNRLPRLRYTILISLLLICICAVWQAHSSTILDSPIAQMTSEVVVYNYVLPVGLVLLLLGLLREDSTASRLLSHPVAQALGSSSYAFYLIHIGILPKVLQKTGLANTSWLLFGWLIVLAHGLHVLIEKPLLQHLRSVDSPAATHQAPLTKQAQ